MNKFIILSYKNIIDNNTAVFIDLCAIQRKVETFNFLIYFISSSSNQMIKR